ncbi:alpha/beta fold hydrolase [Hahella ganghwensis]|uniref:alpha/beta fold hydrolase n=1 Tax=Hahella ganghwensis TaxID=286420 RepID=UPI0003A63A20|nr:alpha/beta hydrolase [Hahella ganghwensis]
MALCSLPTTCSRLSVKYAHLNRVRIAYETFGDPAAPTLLLIMGLGAQMLVWPDALCRHLASQGFHVVRFDNRDIGLSSKIDGINTNLTLNLIRKKFGLALSAPYNLEDMAQDAAELLDHLNIKRAHIAGASMGGMIAQVLAANHPERVISLSLIMTSSGFSAMPTFSPRLALSLIRKQTFQNRDLLYQHKIKLIRAIGSTSYPAPEAELLSRLSRVIERCDNDAPGTRRQTTAMMVTGRLDRFQNKIFCPTQVLHGDEDQLIRAAQGREVAQRIRGASYELIQGMGHDFPTPLLARISRLLRQHAQQYQNIHHLVGTKY